MRNIINRFKVRIPREYKREFRDDMLKENLLKSMFCAGFIVALETIIFLFLNQTSAAIDGMIVMTIIGCNVLFFPILYFFYKRPTRSVVQNTTFLFYCLMFMLLYAALSVIPQVSLPTINTYIMVIFALAAIMCISPVESLALYLTVYLVFYFTLPLFQPNAYAVMIFRLNAFGMNVFAWGLSVIVYKMKITNFLDKKVIEQKNTLLKDMLKRDSMTAPHQPRKYLQHFR